MWCAIKITSRLRELRKSLKALRFPHTWLNEKCKQSRHTTQLIHHLSVSLWCAKQVNILQKGRRMSQFPFFLKDSPLRFVLLPVFNISFFLLTTSESKHIEASIDNGITMMKRLKNSELNRKHIRAVSWTGSWKSQQAEMKNSESELFLFFSFLLLRFIIYKVVRGKYN